jgi:hypothetical protein
MIWQPIETAPKDGTRIVGMLKKYGVQVRRVTWWGKTSHVPLYGWCHGRVEETDLWEPVYWKPRNTTSTTGANK